MTEVEQSAEAQRRALAWGEQAGLWDESRRPSFCLQTYCNMTSTNLITLTSNDPFCWCEGWLCLCAVLLVPFQPVGSPPAFPRLPSGTEAAKLEGAVRSELEATKATVVWVSVWRPWRHFSVWRPWPGGFFQGIAIGRGWKSMDPDH